MNRARLLLRSFWTLMLFLLAGRVLYRFVWKKYISNNDNYSTDELLEEYATESESVHPITVSYDFKKLIKLLDASSQIKHNVTPFFEKKAKLTKLNRTDVEELLKELLRERVTLRNYILDLKGYSTMGMPVKKYRSLMYYLEILEHNISDMRTILQKKELF
jgi:hypothetical protein